MTKVNIMVAFIVFFRFDGLGSLEFLFKPNNLSIKNLKSCLEVTQTLLDSVDFIVKRGLAEDEGFFPRQEFVLATIGDYLDAVIKVSHLKI